MEQRRINRDAERVVSLPLPKRKPSDGVIRNMGGGLYEAEFWNLEYQVNRFLERASDEYLKSRHEYIVRNLRTLVSEDRDEIPIQKFLSSWYWIRKEYHTRVEFALRGKILAPPDAPLYRPKTAPVDPHGPNAGDVLFRYGKKVHLQSLLSGNIRLANCSKYGHMTGDLAREDTEHKKSAFLAGARTRITTLDGREIKVKGDVTHTVHGPIYYVLSLAAQWDDDLFEDFSGSDACLFIHDTEEFRNRLKLGCEAALPGSLCELFSVEYFDPYERPTQQVFASTMCKDFRFAYQREWRFVCIPPNGKADKDHFTFTTEPLGEIAEVMDRRC